MSTEVNDESGTTIAPRQSNIPVRAGFFDLEGFELMQRIARAFSTTDLVPKQYRGNIASCMIALNMAQRMNADPIFIMQNLYDVHGQPSWSSKFLIGTVNSCGRYTSLKYEWRNEEIPESDEYGCRAWATEKATGERLNGVWVTWKMVKAEGWNARNGSKWKTMPDQMFMYRAAAFWTRSNAPELSLGLPTVEESHDIVDVRADGTVTFGGTEEGGPRAPAAEVVQPQSKSAKAAAAAQPTVIEHVDKDGVIERHVESQREREPAQRSAPRARPKQEQEQFDDAPRMPISDSVLRVLKTKMEQNAVNEKDIVAKFGFDLDGVTTANYNAVVEFVENPMAG